MNIIRTGTNWIIEDRLNSDLLDEIKNFFNNHLEFLYKDKENYSTTGDNAEQYWIKWSNNKYHPYNYKNSEYDAIEKKFRKEIYERLKSASLLRNEKIEIEQSTAWTIVGEEGSYHQIHNHSDRTTVSGVSVVLYLNVPEKVYGNDNCIFLVLHMSPENAYINNSIPAVQHISPEIGTILIFPNYVLHGTYPQSKGIRQTFNVDYEFTIKSKSILNYTLN
jgi:hypothetical protein